MIDIHPSAQVSPLADIEESVRGSRIALGAHSRIDSFVKIKPAGGSGDLLIGDHSIINSGCVLYTGNGITLGNHVAVAANCTFAPVNHAVRDRSRLIRDQGFMPSKGGIVVEDDVWSVPTAYCSTALCFATGAWSAREVSCVANSMHLAFMRACHCAKLVSANEVHSDGAQGLYRQPLGEPPDRKRSSGICAEPR